LGGGAVEGGKPLLRKLFGLGKRSARRTVKRKRAKRKTAKRSKGRKRRSSEVTRLLRRIYGTRDPYAIRAAQEAMELYRSGYYDRKRLIEELRETLDWHERMRYEAGM